MCPPRCRYEVFLSKLRALAISLSHIAKIRQRRMGVGNKKWVFRDRAWAEFPESVW
jgi:hypothetical protein